MAAPIMIAAAVAAAFGGAAVVNRVVPRKVRFGPMRPRVLGSGDFALHKLHYLPQGALSLNDFGEKFADPWPSFQFGPYNQFEGREYLRGLAKTGSVRVDAMIAKIFAHGNQPLYDVEKLREAGAELAQLAIGRQIKTRDDVNSYILKIGSSFGPAGGLVANAYVALSKAIDLNTGAAAKAASVVESAVTMLRQATQKSLAAGLPYTWKLPEYLGASGYADGSSEDALFIEHLGIVAYCNANRLLELQQSAQSVIGQWWALLLEEMARSAVTPDGIPIEKVMRSMHGGAWGGMQNFASDEQVMLVAAPFASAYKVSLRELATKLWDQSRGWGEPSESHLLFTPIRHEKYDGFVQESYCAATSKTDPIARTPANATQVQWHNLVKTVKKLVGAP